jgi:ABC-type sugar transport system ATPase subunit
MIRLEKITKRFGATTVLHDVDFAVGTGEVHGLVGANGAGKSTLVKVASGALRPDGGTLYADGWRGDALTPRLAQDLGIATIYQDPALVPTLGLVENVVLGREQVRGRALLRDGGQRADALAALGRVGLERPSSAPAGDLSPGEQQLLEIAKALFRRARLVIMDEPTAALGETERERLFRLVGDLRRAGVAVLYISHHLDEVLELCDTVTVMRDGRPVLRERSSSLDERHLVEAMIGHDPQPAPAAERRLRDTALEVRALSQGSRLTDVSFALRSGEILGVTGLVGSGRSRLARVLYGIERPTEGTMSLFGAPYAPRSPREAIRRGVGLVPEDRKRDALLMDLGAAQNISVARLPTRARLVVDRRAELASARSWIERLGVRPPSPVTPPSQMSGGNQQKLVLARWMHARARLLILDEPGQGVDVAAREHILRSVRELASEGVAVLLISQELEELQQAADRVLVMRRGRIAGELRPAEVTESVVIPLAMGTARAPTVEVASS